MHAHNHSLRANSHTIARIVRLIQFHGASLQEIAKASGLSYGTVKRIREKGHSRPITRRKLEKGIIRLEKRFGLPPEKPGNW